MWDPRGYPGAHHCIMRRKSYMFGYLALNGSGNRRAEGTPRGDAFGLRKFAHRSPKPSLSFGSPPPVDVNYKRNKAHEGIPTMLNFFSAL